MSWKTPPQWIDWMKTEALFRVVVAPTICPAPAQPPRLRAISLPPLTAPLRLALLRAQHQLLGKQDIDGSWAAKRQGNRTRSALLTTCEAITTLTETGIDSQRPEMIDAKNWVARNARSLEQMSNAELVQLLQAIEALQSKANSEENHDSLPPGLKVVRNTEHSFGIYFPEEPEEEHEAQEAEFFNETTQRCKSLLTSRQRADGGWNDAKFFSPESCPQQTSSVLNALLATENVHRKCIDQAVEFLLAAQQPNGCWQSEANDEEPLATAQTLIVLSKLNLASCMKAISNGTNWLLASQQKQADATQTAWTVLALLAAGEPLDRATGRSIQRLLDSQETNGTWLGHPEAIHTATRAMAKFAIELGDTLQSEKPKLKLVGV